MILETERLRLEPLAPEHAQALRAIWSDPEVARFLISAPASPAEQDALFARNLEAAGRFGLWALRGFGALGFSEVVALVRPANARATRLLGALGFASESRLLLAGAPADLYRLDAARFAETAPPEPPSPPRGR